MTAEQPNTDGIRPDNPISEENEDLLGRHPLAYRIADMINNLSDDYKHSVVIGIEGAWGAGKSSFINLILNKVRPSENSLIVEFNPWNFSDQNELIKDFFNSITNALDKIYSRKSLTRRIYEKLSDRFRLYRLRRFCKQIFLAIPYLPRLLPIDTLIKGLKLLLKVMLYPFRLLGIDIFIKGVRSLFRLGGIFILELFLVRRPPKSPSKQIKSYSSKLLKLGEISVAPTISILGIVNIRINALWKSRYSDDDSLEDQRKEIDKFLNKLPRRLVIVIDDVDRLDIQETKLIFKLVKLTTDFPNTVFLLAYDRHKVGKRMDEKITKDNGTGIKGEEYLGKIVQLPFLMPKPDPEDIINILRRAISDELNLEDCDEKSWDEERFDQLVDNREFKELFPTIRDIRRYTNSLRLDLRIIDKSEINQVDFIIIEAIRVFAPEVYLAMSNEKTLFTRMNAFFLTGQQKSQFEAKRKAYIERIVDNAPEDLRESIKEIVHQLFPQIKDLDSGIRLAYEEDESWEEMRRVCSKEMFDKYFRLSVPPALLSVGQMREFILTANDIDALTEKWQGFLEQNKIEAASRRVRAHLDELDDQQRENLLVSMFDFAENTEMDEQKQKSLGYFAEQTKKTVDQMLTRVEKKKRTEFIMNLIRKTSGFFIMNRFLNDSAERALIYEKQGREKPLLIKSEVDELRHHYVEKIKSALKENSLIGSKGWGQTLRILGSKEESGNYIEELIKTGEGVLKLLREFDQIEKSPIDKSAREMLAEVIELDKLDERVDGLNVNKLSEEDAKIVELYENPPGDEDLEEAW